VRLYAIMTASARLGDLLPSGALLISILPAEAVRDRQLARASSGWAGPARWDNVVGIVGRAGGHGAMGCRTAGRSPPRLGLLVGEESAFLRPFSSSPSGLLTAAYPERPNVKRPLAGLGASSLMTRASPRTPAPSPSASYRKPGSVSRRR